MQAAHHGPFHNSVVSRKSIYIDLQGLPRGLCTAGDNVTFLMTKSLDPFRFLLIAVCGWMNEQQLELIDGSGRGRRPMGARLPPHHHHHYSHPNQTPNNR